MRDTSSETVFSCCAHHVSTRCQHSIVAMYLMDVFEVNDQHLLLSVGYALLGAGKHFDAFLRMRRAPVGPCTSIPSS